MTLAYNQVPYVFSLARARFDDLFQSAFSRTVRLGWFDDSQGSSPNAQGVNYIPNLNSQFFRRYGNCPETQLCSTSADEANPGWLFAAAIDQVDTSSQDSSLFPYGVLPPQFRNYYGNTGFGEILLNDGITLTDPSLRAGTYLKIGNDLSTARVGYEILAATSLGANEITWAAAPNSGHGLNIFAAQSASGVTSLGLNSPTFAVKTQTLSLPYTPGNPYMQVFLNGSGAGAVFVGGRFKSAIDSSGVVIQPIARPGASTATYLASSANSGLVLQAIGLDAAVLHYGANDATVGALAAQVNATRSGWFAQAQADFANWPSADFKPLQGAVTALNGGRDLEIYAESLQPFAAWSLDDLDDSAAASTGWRLDEETGELFGRFPRGRLNLRIDYQAGFATIPEPVQEACVQLVQDLYQASLVNNTLKKATLGSSSIELKTQTAAGQVSGKVRLLLAPYIDYSRAIFR